MAGFHPPRRGERGGLHLRVPEPPVEVPAGTGPAAATGPGLEPVVVVLVQERRPSPRTPEGPHPGRVPGA